MQHERRALRGRELLEHGQQRVADRLVERDAVRRVVRHERLREPRTDVGLAARASGPQAIEREPGDDRRQPAVEVLDRLRVRALQPQPRLLHDVLRLADVAELAVGEPQQPRACLREALRGGHAAIRPQVSVPARMRGAQPLASRSRRLDTRCERAIGPSCGARGRRASTPTAAASAASISAFVGGSASATLYVPAGARSAAAMAAAASSSHSVGRYAPGGPSRDRGAAARGLQRGLRGPAVGSDEQPEAQHDGVAVEQLARVALGRQRGRRHAAAGDRRILVEPRVAAVGVHERDRLLHEPLHAGGLGGARDRRRRLGAHAVVLLPGGRIGHAIGARDVGQQVDDGVRPVERAAQRRLVEHVGLDGARPEALEPLAAARGARHARDAVAGGEQLADGAPPDDARGSGDHDLVHARLTSTPLDRDISASSRRNQIPRIPGVVVRSAFWPSRGGRSFHEQPSRSPSPGSAGCPGRRAGRRRAGARHHGAGRAVGEQQGRRLRRAGAAAKPTNPKNRAACDKYYSAANKLAEAQGCRAKAAYNVAKKACAKKSGAKKAACLKAAKRKFTRRQGQGRQAGEGREGLPGRVHEGLQRDRGADLRARSQRPGLRRAAAALQAQETAAGDDAAGLPEEGAERLNAG